MSESILQVFLNKQFIKTTDTGNIESLTKAVAAVKSHLTKKKHQIIPYTLVALDPQIPESEPVITEVETLIIKSWTTFKNSTSTNDKATTYVRVVILQALAELAKDVNFGAIIWLAGRNIISYYQARKEREDMASLLIKAGTSFESNSQEFWSTIKPNNPAKDIDPLKISLVTKGTSKIAAEDIKKHLIAASNYSGWSSQGNGGENPTYTSHGDWQWAVFFSQRAATGLAEVLNTALSAPEKSTAAIVSTIETEINNYFSHIQHFYVDAQKAFSQSALAANKRGDLLWWKQTLYSPSLNRSYRNLSMVSCAMAMAKDLSNLVGLLYPESVNYLLREAIREVYGNVVDKKEPMSVWKTAILELKGDEHTMLQFVQNETSGRKMLVSFIANALSKNNEANLTSETGIEESSEISVSDLAVWLFNDLQAFKFSQQK